MREPGWSEEGVLVMARAYLGWAPRAVGSAAYVLLLSLLIVNVVNVRNTQTSKEFL